MTLAVVVPAVVLLLTFQKEQRPADSVRRTVLQRSGISLEPELSVEYCRGYPFYLLETRGA